MTPDQHVDLVLFWVTVGAAIVASLGLAVVKLINYLEARNMSSASASAGGGAGSTAEQRSYAAEQVRNSAEQDSGTAFLPTIHLLERCTDDERLAILAHLRGPDGEYLYTESRIGRFIGGRTEDRIAQVRELRGTTPPAAPGRVLRISDGGQVREIPFDAPAAKR